MHAIFESQSKVFFFSFFFLPSYYGPDPNLSLIEFRDLLSMRKKKISHPSQRRAQCLRFLFDKGYQFSLLFVKS